MPMVKDPVLSAHVHACATAVLSENRGAPVSRNDVLGADLGYAADSVLTLIRSVQDRLNQAPPPAHGPFWLPRTPKQQGLTAASVGGFEDWIYHQCEASMATRR